MDILKKELMGKVVSNKMSKTVVVETSRQVRHPSFKKYYTKRKKFKAHDEKNECQIGDTVLVRECRPLSREKCWTVTKIVEKAVAV
ncbi:MAG: 30S ribosomal protein S17 [Deltaproteobacteria bacterium GWA2_45_12]|nr:MAG: 30S ribosomal protein S17 [Deltaproteobacteria bacterium GWA2_45_12]